MFRPHPRPRHILGLALALGVPVAAAHGTPQLHVHPLDAAADVPVDIRVCHLHPTEKVTLELTTRDAEDALWRGRATYHAGIDGCMTPDDTAPLSGSYRGIHPMGLFWSMLPTGKNHGVFYEPWRKDASSGRYKPLHYRLHAFVDGREIGSATLTRQLTSPGVRVQHIHTPTLTADLYLPADASPQHPVPGLVTLDGAEGGIEAADQYASWLASHGYAGLAVAWYHAKGLPQNLIHVPIAPVEHGIDLLQHRADVDPNEVGLMGGSWGGILSMLVGAHDPRVHAVVSWVGGPILWNGLRRNVPPTDFRAAMHQSPFLIDGKPQPFVNAFAFQRYLKQRDFSILKPGLIPIWRTRGPVMIVGGGDDGMEQSGLMAALTMRLMHAHHHAYADRALYFPDAGHLISAGYTPVHGLAQALPGLPPVGGTEGGYARADAASGPAVLAFLHRAFASRTATR